MSLRGLLSDALNHYGMAVVLVLLCGYYSWATLRDQQPAGAEAARAVAKQLGTRPATVLVIAGSTEQDAAFADTANTRLRELGHEVVAVVKGDPRAARQALLAAARPGRALDWIATTADCAAWTVLEDLPGKFPALGQPRLVIAPAYRWPTFLKRENLLNIANQIAVVAILAAGMTVVIVTGGIDLSVGSLIALSAVTGSLVIRAGGGAQAGTAVLLWGSASGIGICALAGLFSGTMITVFRIPPFIATLAVMQVANGAAYLLAKGGSIYELPDAFTWLGRGTGPGGIPIAVLLMLAVYAATHLLLSRTRLGRHVYAVGSNVETARLCGVRVPRVLLFAYGFCGALAGLGGVVLASQLKSGAPTYGLAYELYVIAAVVVGGASLSGGQGRIFGTLIGAFIIGVIQNGMNLTGVESYTQKIVLGAVILGAVLLDQMKKRGHPRSS